MKEMHERGQIHRQLRRQRGQRRRRCRGCSVLVSLMNAIVYAFFVISISLHLPSDVDPRLVLKLEVPFVASNHTTARLQQELDATTKDRLLPPLSSLIRDDKIVGNVSFLLDTAIIGFAKCGTSTLSAWLESHPHMKSLPGESFALYNHDPARLAKWLWTLRQESINHNSSNYTAAAMTGQYPKHFYKQPKDAYSPHVLSALQKYWPQTKLIYTLRHPVLWFESYWNFRYRRFNPKPEIPIQVIGRKGGLNARKGVYEPLHTGLGEYHVFMSMLGKTAQSDNPAEWALIKPFLKTHEHDFFPFPKTSNPIFFLDSSQLSDTNETRLSQLQHDLSNFLQLQQDNDAPLLPLPIPHIRPEKEFLNTSQLQDHYSSRFDICRDQYKTLRALLLWTGAASSQWLRQYFMISPDVHYSSVDRHLENILASWSVDPCTERKHKQEQQPQMA